MNIKEKSVFSKILERELTLITLENNSLSVTLSNYGAMITSIIVKPQNIDILLGCNTIDEYINQDKYFGATIGRYANRIENGTFKLNNKVYNISPNESPNHLHGGAKGFDKKVWNYEIIDDSVIFNYFSENMEEGYPGNLHTKVKYTLSDSNELLVKFYAETDEDTIVNLTNHSYFNLNGEDNNSVKNHIVKINSDFITEIDEKNIPTGKLTNVVGTNFDFKEERSIEDALNLSETIISKDYDHNYVLLENKEVNASIYSPLTNIKLELSTSYPCMQFYTGSFLNNFKGKTRNYNNFSSICLEPQFAPNSINIPEFKQPVLRKEENYYEFIKYKFSF